MTSVPLPVPLPASSLTAARRRADLEALASGAIVDVLVVGGGITGVGVALDAASRGLSVALVERDDLAAGTSRWSSKLVHGGLRYLAHGDVGLALESARERGTLMERTAPHLTRALPFVLPLGADLGPLAGGVVAVGLRAGNVLRMAAGTRRATLPAPRRISAAEAALLVPGLRTAGLRGALLQWDCQLVDDARLVVGVARTAAAHGARIITACRAVELTGDGAVLEDVAGGGRLEVRARHVVQATGVWSDRLSPDVALRPSKGAHLVVPAARLGDPVAAALVPIPGTTGRYVFSLPQGDGRVLIGLTDTPLAGPVPDVPVVDDEDERTLLATISRALEAPLGAADVIGRFAGLRPLLEGRDGSTADLSRAHRIIEGADGLLTIVGGKLTTYRRMAADVVDAIAARPGVVAGPCRTARLPLVGAASQGPLRRAPVPARLVRRYGAEAPAVLALGTADPALLGPVAEGQPTLLAELAWGLAHEGARTVDDLLDLRTRIGLVDAERAAALPAAEALVAGVRAAAT
jgi:glycerol-3-phosphate dehydrogenase